MSGKEEKGRDNNADSNLGRKGNYKDKIGNDFDAHDNNKYYPANWEDSRR